MANLILIETSTSLCSVAFTDGDKITGYKESIGNHAANTAKFIEDLLRETATTIADYDAVCVSEGPGSYTGLRVGVSTAKGLCFASHKPLTAVSSLETLVWQAIDMGLNKDVDYIIPMIDARRMEVYTAIFDKNGNKTSDIEAKIIDENSFEELLKNNKVLFIGDGAEKCSKVITNNNASFLQCHPKASSLKTPGIKAFNNKDFKDIAYFEPMYLKEFIATVSKKKLF